MKKTIILSCLLFSASFVTEAKETPNTLTKKEVKQGWRLLFDGKTTNGWHTWKKQEVLANWTVADGALTYDPSKGKEGSGDLVTNEEFENFELNLEWKISPNGNSGIYINSIEDPKYGYGWFTGPEIQVLDNDGHPDGKIEKHRAGNLYDLIKSTEEPVKPVGQWNAVKIISNRGALEIHLNGVKVVETRMDNQNWKDLIANSKFKNMPDFGKFLKGHIVLQDHGNLVWYRNIKIKTL
ncbi:3-keto-disaccharide hydrolase [Flectobacillus major]|jgi:hypothetical protein|uniref:3-keto-disaccharide hydrolase n=1 Tax=Flectobacillus major TaxID=103 RepID=UPI00040B559B|nr:DUF1080 domain-containing protein [Flectobacillus major]